MPLDLSFPLTVFAVLLGIALWQALAMMAKSLHKSYKHAQMEREAKAKHEELMRTDPNYRAMSARFDEHMKHKPDGIPDAVWAMGFNPHEDEEDDENECEGCTACKAKEDADNVRPFPKRDDTETQDETTPT